MKFLVIRKRRMGTGMMPTSQMIRAHKDMVLSAVKLGKPTAFMHLWEVVVSAFRTPIQRGIV